MKMVINDILVIGWLLTLANLASAAPPALLVEAFVVAPTAVVSATPDQTEQAIARALRFQVSAENTDHARFLVRNLASRPLGLGLVIHIFSAQRAVYPGVIESFVIEHQHLEHTLEETRVLHASPLLIPAGEQRLYELVVSGEGVPEGLYRGRVQVVDEFLNEYARIPTEIMVVSE